MSADSSLKRQALSSIFWGVAQSWGGKLILFVLFLVLARILTPLEFGVVSAAVSIMLIVTQIADFGFGDAIVQRSEVKDEDINLPFYFSFIFSILISLALFVWADKIGDYLKVEGIASVLKVMSLVGPLTILSQIQETVLRKRLQYKKLAIRVFVANTTSGFLAVVVALLGGGVWSLVLQALATVILSLLWLWWHPVWKPSLELNWVSFFQLKRYARNVAGVRVLDILATRAVELLILSYFGPTVLGLYSVGSRVYMTLMQLFQGALSDVALSLLSRIVHDRSLTVDVYFKTSTLSALLVSPIFLCLAVVAGEVGAVLFGKKWDGVHHVLQPLLLVGAVQCVQLINSTYLSARGRPGLVLLMGAVKAPVVIGALYLSQGFGVEDMMFVYSVAQLVTTPLSFYFISKNLEISWRLIGASVLPVVSCLAIASISSFFLRIALVEYIEIDLLRAALVGALFLFVYVIALYLLARSQVRTVNDYISSRFKKG